MTREDVYRITGALANATLQEKVRTGNDIMPIGTKITPEDFAILEPFFRMNVKTIYTFESGLKFEVEFSPGPQMLIINKGEERYINPPREFINAWYEAADQIIMLYKKIPKEKLYSTKRVD